MSSDFNPPRDKAALFSPLVNDGAFPITMGRILGNNKSAFRFIRTGKIIEK